MKEIGQGGLTSNSSPHPFDARGLSILQTNPALQMRLKLPSIFLRVANDPKLAAGDTSHLNAPDAGRIFSSSQGLYDGIYMLDPYVGPLRGATSPSVWCLAALRTFGTLIVLLGRGIGGTHGDAAEPLQTITVKSPSSRHLVPSHDLLDQFDALNWWARALNRLFGVISDPTVFTDRAGVYNASAQLSAILSIEQLFRRITSSLVQHRDVTARHVLMYTCLDTLEGLTGRSLTTQFELSQAEKCLVRIRASMPDTAQRVLLANADRAVSALMQVQHGFTLARSQGMTGLRWANKSATFERAAANYLVALRNATHGHGGDKGTAEQRERNTTLMIQHNGEVPEDLSLLAYLYLVEFLDNPDRLRKILGGSAG